MENIADEIQPTIEVNAGESPSPGKKIARRRFVQSTLFPHKSPEKKDVGDGGGVDGREEEEEEECCGSQGRRKRKLTPVPKAASRPRRAKKVAQNGKVAFQEVMDENNSPGVASPESQKEKKQASTRNRKTNVIQDNYTGSLPDHTTLSDHIPQPVPNLWLEAKKTAEEDSRRFAGRKLHPFFSLQKMGKKTQETANPESGQSFIMKEEKNIECGPIHVYETHKDDNITSIDWRNWDFHDEVYVDSNCHKQMISSSSDRAVESLCLDKILHTTNSLKDLSLNHESAAHEEAANREMTPPSHDTAEPCQLLEDINMAGLIFRSVNSSCLVSDAEQDNSTSQEWLPYSFLRTNQPHNSLWTCKYQPEKAVEVCGNAESVKLINDWLCLWRERDLQKCKKSIKLEKFSLEEDCSDDTYCDLQSMDEEAGLKNVLLVMGPVGCGKSAAIYACAKEQGFEVIEVNSSDWRSGARIKQRFSEAVGLHWLKGSPENPKALQSTLKKKAAFSTLSRVSTANEFDEDATQIITIPDDETANDAVVTSQRSLCNYSNIKDTSEIKTLILFEEVDATLLEDRGFIATIQQLAQTAKRPMILTSNDTNPVLPESLDREEVYFSVTSQQELLHHVCMVCNVEKSFTDPDTIDKYIQYCQGDVRKTLMHLQFWCQGQQPNTDGNAHRIYSPLMFDLKAAHDTLSKIIPWGFSSQLSERIEMEIAKSCGIEEQLGLFEVNEEVEYATIMLDEHETNERLELSIEAKKKVMLTKNFTSDDNDLITWVANAGGVSNSSGSPVAFSRMKICRKLSVVMFDSDDEISNYGPLGKSDNLCRDDDNVLTAATVDPLSQIRWPAVDGLLTPTTGQPVCSSGNKLVESWHQCSLTENENNEVFQSSSVSCVPESTFVPETEVCDGTEISAREDQREVLSPAILQNPSQPISIIDGLSEVTESRCNMDDNLEDDEMGDSHNGCEDSTNFTRGYQIMDECSRMDFFKGSRRLKKCNSKLKTNTIQETWKELQCSDFRPHITEEDKNASQAMKLASGICNLIADADMLLHDCKILTSESFIPGTDLVEDFFTFGWHDQQLQMISAIAEHGYCIFAKNVAALGSRIGLDCRVDIAREMLASTNNSVALGKLLRHGRRIEQLPGPSAQLQAGLTVTGNSFEREASLDEIVHSVVPPKCYFSLRGNTLKEYLSTLAHMSKSEAHRASDSPDNTRRRSRKQAPKNYLCSGSLCLTPQEISSLVAYKRFLRT
ncbi:hypothetical protein V2J09_000871 [Rumex salicifolius]